MNRKIVHLIGQLGRGGAERQLFFLARSLKKRGWNQAVISFDLGGPWAARLLEEEIAVHEIPRHPIKPWRLLRLGVQVRRERADVLLSWSAHVGVYAHWLRGVGPLRRVFNLREDLSVDARTGAPGSNLRQCRAAIERADHLVSNSRRNVEVLREHGLHLPETQVIYNIVFAQGGARPAAASATPRIVAVGSLIPRKAHGDLLRAAARLKARGKAFELLIAGKGAERPRLEALTAELGLGARVTFLGEIEDVRSLLITAHLVAHPSLSEGSSNTILEAMAEGLPVVATPTGGTPEIVEEGRTGLLVPPGSPEALAAALERLLVDPALRGRLGEAGLQRVKTQCGEEPVTTQYEQVFSRVLDAGAARSAV
jgi:glycosyltransferase involved in cell wall biosynthesis